MNYLLVCLLAFQIAAPDASRLAEEPDARKRAEMVRELMRRFEPSVIPKLVAVAESDPDPSVRKLLVERLGRNRFPTIIEFLERRAVS
ncbi:MAG: HEAT repeat domain-containing protein, partial [Bryobacterales bacterium]|nr:HEAT repeat domain-containing protein [Bryobacterales bacterium]